MDDVDWDRTVFVLLGPDAIERHLASEILDRLARLDFRPVAWRTIWHRPADLDAFHERNIAQAWQAYLYRLVDQLFAFGPTVALLARDERPERSQTCHQRLRQAKGSSHPDRAGPGTIRGDLRSINVMLSLMHSADTADDARHESAVFAGSDGFAGGFVDGFADGDGDLAELRGLVDLLQLARPAERRGYAEVLAGVRARALAAVWSELTPVGRATATRLGCAGVAQLTLPGAGARVADLLPAGHPLAGVLRAEFTPDSPGPDLGRVRALLRVHGADLDAWADLVLTTSRRFAPRRELAVDPVNGSAVTLPAVAPAKAA